MTADEMLTQLPTWTIDSCQSQAWFTARHLSIAAINGILGPIAGRLQFDPDVLSLGSAEIAINVAALSTGHRRRDDELRSADFFDVEHYPTIAFRSTRVLYVQGDKYQVRGELTIKGVTQAVALAVTYGGQIPDPYGPGSFRAGFTAQTTLSRREFAMTYDPLLPTGGAMVSDAITTVIHVEAVRQG